jgi:hypothetical protein
MAYNSFANSIPFKWPWSANDNQPQGQDGQTAGTTASFRFPSNMAQAEEEPQAAFNQPAQGQRRGPRQYAPSFGASSGGGSHFRSMGGG